jgi:hypothetical protein
MNEKGQTIYTSSNDDVISEQDINEWIYTQHSGLYKIHLERKRGRKEIRIIARL